LFVTKQHLAGGRAYRSRAEQIVRTVRDLPYVQWDPVSVVAPSHLLSLWARVGPFRSADLDRLLWKERRLLQHWIPFAGIVATEDYPLYRSLMVRYPESLSSAWGRQRARARAFLARNGELRKRVLAELRGGPLQLGQFQDHVRAKRSSAAWQPSSTVSEMLWHLLMSGEVMVVGHEGTQNLWGLTSAFLPPWTDRTTFSEEEADRMAAQRALKGLGVATPKEIRHYFVRGCYRDVRATLETLVADGRVQPVVVDGLPSREAQYVHADDAELLADLGDGPFSPRFAVLPPFDNMVCDPARGLRLFGFEFVREQFLPRSKRRFGMWVLPILWGDRFVGRADARFDKEGRQLRVEALYAERDAPREAEIARGLRSELERLANFIGAESVGFTPKVPAGWKAGLR